MKKILILVTIALTVSGCETSGLPKLSPGIANPIGIPNIDDPVWKKITLWPKIIKRDSVEYQIVCYGKNGDNEQIAVAGSDLENIDIKFHYYAYYLPVFIAGHKYKKEDYEFGPTFAWRPDGSIYSKAITDENQNHEFYYFYKNGQIANQSITDFENDVYSEKWFDELGNIVGQSTIQYGSTWYRKIKQSCEWEGESYPDCTDCEFIKNGNDFISENKHKIW